MSITNKKYRIGRFSVSLVLIQDAPEVVLGLMGSCIVVKAEQDYQLLVVNYIGLNVGFREIAKGEPIPEYRVVIYEREGGSGYGFELFEKGDSDYILARNMGIRPNLDSFKYLPK